MKRLDQLRIPDEWGISMLAHVRTSKSPRRLPRWLYYLLVTAFTALIAAGALKQYFTQT